MFSIEYFIIAVFYKIDELLKEITTKHQIRAKGFAPALSDENGNRRRVSRNRHRCRNLGIFSRLLARMVFSPQNSHHLRQKIRQSVAIQTNGARKNLSLS